MGNISYHRIRFSQYVLSHNVDPYQQLISLYPHFHVALYVFGW